MRTKRRFRSIRLMVTGTCHSLVPLRIFLVQNALKGKSKRVTARDMETLSTATRKIKQEECQRNGCRSGAFSNHDTFVAVNTYTHSVTYVTDNILRSLQTLSV